LPQDMSDHTPRVTDNRSLDRWLQNVADCPVQTTRSAQRFGNLIQLLHQLLPLLASQLCIIAESRDLDFTANRHTQEPPQQPNIRPIDGSFHPHVLERIPRRQPFEDLPSPDHAQDDPNPAIPHSTEHGRPRTVRQHILSAAFALLAITMILCSVLHSTCLASVAWQFCTERETLQAIVNGRLGCMSSPVG
jgi:hypothetical protein